ncbi:MAG: GNAT family N-acetyltransferase, partial [Candidatus Nomurabacteria bacterium]|nr:GNAT family N-acetyltransferase [Candidatus Nomurabacteria bacterium]
VFASKLSPDGLSKTRERIANASDDPDTIQLVAKDGSGKVVGAISATRGEKGREIHMLYTDKAVHGTGVGGALMAQVIDWLGDDEEVVLNVASKNDRAKTFYRKFGFKEIGEPYVNENHPKLLEQKMLRPAK